VKLRVQTATEKQFKLQPKLAAHSPVAHTHTPAHSNAAPVDVGAKLRDDDQVSAAAHQQLHHSTVNA
jgi:hypothetical protein